MINKTGCDDTAREMRRSLGNPLLCLPTSSALSRNKSFNQSALSLANTRTDVMILSNQNKHVQTLISRPYAGSGGWLRSTFSTSIAVNIS